MINLWLRNFGDIIGSIETTKADIDLESEFEGIIKIISESRQ